MRIQVRWGYALSLGQYIPPGIYESDDPALFGLAQYLLDNGHAALEGTLDVPFEDAEGDEDDDLAVESLTETIQPNPDLVIVAAGINFEDKTRAELRLLAADLGFKGVANLSKTDLLEMLNTWKAQQEQE